MDDGESRLLNQNDCRLHDLASLSPPTGPIDQQWLQYSGRHLVPDGLRLPARASCGHWSTQKVEAQLARALRYVEAVGARVVVPSAGPPCFLDPELFDFNVITGDELSIFPDATVFIERLAEDGIDTGSARHPGHARSTSRPTA